MSNLPPNWPAAWRESPQTHVWNVTEKARQVGTEHPADNASLAVWLVHAPWMHPAWSWHYVGLVHLRDLPGQSKRPVLTVDGATHEFLVMAVDPSQTIDLGADKWEPLKLLSPISIVQQFVAAGDAKALERVEDCLALVARDIVTLDSDGRHMWRHLLVDCPALKSHTKKPT